MYTFSRSMIVALLSAMPLASCATAPAESGSGTAAPGHGTAAPGPSVVQASAPGQASRVLSERALADLPRPVHVEADTRFMQEMIAHHAQALEMVVLVPDRTPREDIRLLARRIDRAQDDEMALMRRWLEMRGEDVPASDGGAHSDQHGGMGHVMDHGAADSHALMPGMLTPEQMAELAAAEGPDFDQLFLEFMIYHHEGALAMVAALFANDGAAQDAELFEFAAHVDGDQRIEIERMRRMMRSDR